MNEQELIRKASEELGKHLAELGHTVLVGSDDPEDVDPSVVRGAMSANKPALVEVHLRQGAPDCYQGVAGNGTIKNIPHRYKDWDVTVLEVLRHRVDAVIALAGRVGVVQTGVAGWMLGLPVMPIACFQGGAATVWGYGSGARSEFYFGALSDEEIDRLQASWVFGGESASFFTDALWRIVAQARRSRTAKYVFLLVSVLVLLSMFSWVALIAAPLIGYLPSFAWLGLNESMTLNSDGVRFLLLLISVCAAGAFGALMRTLRGIRDDRPATLQRVVIDVVLGIAAGFLTAALYLVAQIAISGTLVLPSNGTDYARVGLIVGLAAMFSSLYLDAALKRFDNLKDSVIAGTYGSSQKLK